MKRLWFLTFLVFYLFSSIFLFGQEEYFKSAPFNSGIIESVLKTPLATSYCEIHFDNYGERFSVDLTKSQGASEVIKSIICKEDYLYYILHNKKQVMKIPMKERTLAFDTTRLQKISDTLFLGYKSVYYTSSNDSLEAIYYYDLLLFMHDKRKSEMYEVLKVSENESFPEFVFFLPRGFNITEMNYNFSE